MPEESCYNEAVRREVYITGLLREEKLHIKMTKLNGKGVGNKLC
jgi:hypothetical protein